MGIGKNRVFNTNQITRLIEKTQALMDTADAVVNEIYSELGSLSSALDSLPGDVRDGGLKNQVEWLRNTIRTSDFKEYRGKITKSLAYLNQNIALQDKRLALKIEHVAAIVESMATRLDSLKALIVEGEDSGTYEDFEKEFKKCTQAWDTVSQKIEALLSKIESSLKGGQNIQVCYGGDPVNLSTGNFIHECTDLESKGMPQLKMKRFYNEMDKRVGIFGRGWRHSYEICLAIEEEEYTVILEDGKEEHFFKEKDGSFFGEFTCSKLKKSDNGYEYVTKQGERVLFNESGQIEEYFDQDDNQLCFFYQEERLEKVVRNEDGAYFAFHYNEQGSLERVSDQGKREVRYGYDEEGMLAFAINPEGEKEQYSYDENGRMRAFTDPCGVVKVENTYDEKGRTVDQLFADGGRISYLYEDEERRVTMTERNGSKTTYCRNEQYQNVRTIYEDGEERFAYNRKGQRVMYQDCNGNVMRFAYDNRGNLTQIIDAAGVKTNMTYNQENHLIKLSMDGTEQIKNTYDSQGNLIESRDALGRKNQYRYYRKGKPSEIIKPDGGKVRIAYDEKGNITEVTDPYGSKRVYEYDALNRIVSTTNPSGDKTAYEYDQMNRMTKYTNPLGQVMEYGYNANGNKTRVRRFDGHEVQMLYNDVNRMSAIINAAGKRMDLAYDSMWNISEVTLPDGTKQTYEYDARNRLSAVVDAMGHRTEYEYDGNGNCLLIRDPKGQETKYTYDARNQVESMIDANGGVTRFAYNEKGLLAEKRDALGNVHTYAYDAAGQKVSETDMLGNTTYYSYTPLGEIASISDGKGHDTRYEYEVGGRIRTITYPDQTKELFAYDKNGALIRHTYRDGYEQAFRYDALGRIEETVGSDGQRQQYTYDLNGNVTSITDALGNMKTYEYSLTGHVTKVIDALGNETCYEYDPLDKIKEIKQYGEDCHSTKYERNLCGQVEAVIDALGQKECYRYDANGQLIEKIDKEGYSTNFGYNAVGDMDYIRYADGREVKLTYDPLRYITEINDWLGVTQIENDPLGRIKRVQYPNKKEVRYTFGQFGEKTSVTYPNGKRVRYDYDEHLRLRQLQEGESSVRYSYDTLGRLQEKHFSNGGSSQYSYDAFGRLQQLVHRDVEGVLDQYEYQYDPLGRKTAVKKTRRDLPEESGNWTYKYDPVGRLSEVWKDEVLAKEYQYDAFGNRLKEREDTRTTLYEYNAMNQLLARHTLSAQEERMTRYEYDKRGNMIAVVENGEKKYGYEYGALNRLQRASNQEGQIATYEYNGLGYRVRKQVKESQVAVGQTIHYTIDLTRNVHNLLEQEEDGNSQNFLWDNNVVALSEKQGTNFYVHDELGSPVRIMNAVGQTVESYEYGEFGELRYEENGFAQPFCYTGYERDLVAGTYYAQAREYLPGLGRYASEDRVKGITTEPYTMNPYAYCWNDPCSLVDLTGLSPQQPEQLTKGNEAHVLLQQKFLEDFGGKGGFVEYPIHGGIIRNKSGNGRADIAYFNSVTKTVEVYEIKPGSYAPGATNFFEGTEQLDSYITALLANGQIEAGWNVARGRSLNGYFDTQVIPSVEYPDKEIVYHVYTNGMINYYYRNKRKEPEPDTVPAEVPETRDNTEKYKKAAKVVGIGAGAYVAYRIIRMIPSLLPPLWWTLPANAACP